MEQHPVPQHIASYEFRLVGDMTLKQFGFLAGGVIVALLFYTLPIPGFFKWPLIAFSSFLGFAFAFLPLEERPLHTWLIAFTKAIFSPTQFVWEKSGKLPNFLQTTPGKAKLKKKIPPQTDQTQLLEYLGTLPAEKETLLEKQEKNFLKQINNLFQLAKMPTKMPPRTREAGVKKEIKLPQFSRPKKRTVKAKVSPRLPIPAPPTQPNILVGMVLDKKGELVEGAILEIRNSQGVPVRALKTNQLGQFTIATPLENGVYEIETEKKGLKFDIIKVEVKGEIIKPIEIRAK